MSPRDPTPQQQQTCPCWSTCIQPITRVARTIRGMETYVGVEEERVRSPGEGFGTNVEVLVAGREGEVAIVLGHEVLLVLSMFSLNLLHPEVASRDCFVRVNSNLVFGTGKIPLACRETAVVADLTPEVGGVWREIG
jgi:hypothetical protein